MKLFRNLLLFAFALTMNSTYAQNLMNIHQGNGTLLQIPLESIDSVRFYTIPPPTIQKIFQSNGNILSIAVSDIDSITYTIPDTQDLAQIITQPVTVLSATAAYGGGTISDNGASAVTQRGVCWSTSTNPTLANNFTIDGSGNGSFGSNILPLLPATTYFVRAYAVNDSGTAYGNTQTITTQSASGAGVLPVVATGNLIYYDGLEASCGGIIIADGGLQITAQGVCWAAGTTPTINNFISMAQTGLGTFTNTLHNLIPGTTYFVRAFAINNEGAAYGITYNFTTNSLPIVSTSNITDVTAGSALAGGVIQSDGGSESILGGICLSTQTTPTLNNSVVYNSSDTLGSFTTVLGYNFGGVALNNNTTYYLRAFATNGVGTTYGSVLTFTTLSGGGGGTPAACGAVDVHNPNLYYGTMLDQEGNIYKTIQIGTQKWMAENLKTSIYRNGNSIFNITLQNQVNTIDFGYWCNYNYDIQYDCPYGKLYNWYAVTDPRNLCPAGWHVPSAEEWNTLANFLDNNWLNSNTVGGKMKSSGSAQYWSFPNDAATNESGFSGLPSGRTYTFIEGLGFGGLGSGAYWWGFSETEDWVFSLNEGSGAVYGGVPGGGYNTAVSVRCLNDTTLQLGNINSIDCEETYINGAVILNEPAENVIGYVPYNGGNGGSFQGYSTNSTGVIGLTATLAPGNFATGTGFLALHISGTPTSIGTAYFLVNISGQECTFIVTINSAATCGAGEVHNPNLIYGTMQDQEGNEYKTIQIGDQEWMAENLNTSIYRNGEVISNVTENTQWEALDLGAWCFNNNDSQYECPYGKLYNWYAVADQRNLCPSGWHVPTENEWTILFDYLGGTITAGGKMKSTSTQFWWPSPNVDATNSSGFSGLPGGYRGANPIWEPFYQIGFDGFWWSSSENNNNGAASFLPFDGGNANLTEFPQSFGLSVRCLRD